MHEGEVAGAIRATMVGAAARFSLLSGLCWPQPEDLMEPVLLGGCREQHCSWQPEKGDLCSCCGIALESHFSFRAKELASISVMEPLSCSHRGNARLV